MRKFTIFYISSFLFLSFAFCQNFTFIHISDCHVPHQDSLTFLRSLKDLPGVEMPPYGVTSTKPCFVVATGDLLEFGGGAFSQYLSASQTSGLPWYAMPGNHDNTWFSIRPEMRKLYKSPYYSFDYEGCHFIVLDSSTPQDPRPSFGREQIVWLQKDLASLSKKTPVFIFCHHPLHTTEFVSRRDVGRVLDTLRGYNVVVFVTGHSHQPSLIQYEGFPVLIGGQGYGESAGYNVFYIQDGYLRVAYRKIKEAQANKALFEKSLTALQKERPSHLSSWKIADETTRSRLLWEKQLDGAFKAGLVVSDKHVYGGALDGKIYALDKTSGAVVWAYGTLGEILGRPCLQDGKIFVTSSDGKVYAFSEEGSPVWAKNLEIPLYAGPLASEERLFVADREGGVWALDPMTGEILWHKKDASYTIESTPCLSAEGLFVGAWDGYLYHYRPADGQLLTKIQGVASSRQAASKYYSPADSSPFALSGKLYAADRGYLLGEWDLASGKLLREWDKVAAFSFSPDQKAMYLRKTTGELEKRSIEGERLWSSANLCDAIPTPAVEYDGQVFLCSGAGKLSVLSAETGEVLWFYEVSGGLRVFGEIAFDASALYIADMDGKITALRR